MTRLHLRDLPPEQRERVLATARMDAPTTMNKTEARRAEYLELLKRAGRIHDYRFEALTLRLAHDTRLTPDFVLVMPDGSLELDDVKGRKGDGYYSTEDAAIKIKVAARTYPWFRFFVVWESQSGTWNRKEIKP